MLFLLAAAWVDPGRSALQSAEQRCQRLYGRIHRFFCTSIYEKNMQEGHFTNNNNLHKVTECREKPSTDTVKGAKEGSGEVTRTAPAPEQQVKRRRIDDGFVKPRRKHLRQSQYASRRRWRMFVNKVYKLAFNWEFLVKSRLEILSAR